MKKILLPTLLLTTAIPAVSLSACAQPAEPEPEPEEDTPIELEYDYLDFDSGIVTLTKGKKYVAIIDLTEIPAQDWDTIEDTQWTFSVNYGSLSGRVDKISIDDKIYLEGKGYNITTPNMLKIISLPSAYLKKTYKTLKVYFVPSETNIEGNVRMAINHS